MEKYIELALHNTESLSPEFGDKKLRDFQLFTARVFVGLENLKSLLIFQDTGFGKTLTTIYIMHALKKYIYSHWNIIVLCKASLIEQPWISSMANYLDNLDNIKILAYDDVLLPQKFFTYVKNISHRDRVLIVIDESHNLVSRSLIKVDKRERKMTRVLEEIIKIIHDQTKKNKLLLLSATPIINSVDEFSLLTRLLRPNKTIQTNLFKDSILVYKKELITGLSGMCSYKKNKEFGIFEDVPYFEGFVAKRVHVIRNQMSDSQNALYEKAEKYENENGLRAFKSIRRMVSAFAYKELPVSQNLTAEQFNGFLERAKISFSYEFELSDHNKRFSSEGIEILKKQGAHQLNVRELDIYNRLREYSVKYVSVCEDIIKSPGKCLIFEPFVNFSGIVFLKEYLSIFNISYIEYSSKTKSTRNAMLDTFNSSNNIRGEHIKVCLFSNSGNEGVSYTNVNDIYILDMTWNEATIKQIIGRAIRLDSHRELPLDMRYVNVKFMINTKKQGISVDEELFELIKSKSLEIDQLFDVLRQCSIEHIYENARAPGVLPNNEDLLIEFLKEPLVLLEKTYKKEFVNVKNIYYSFDTLCKNVFVGHVTEDHVIFSAEGHKVGKIIDGIKIKIRDSKLIYIIQGNARLI